MSSFFFATPLDIDIVLEDTDERPTVDVKLDKNRREKAPLYMDGESVKGAVTIRPKDGKRLEHTGIKVQFVGLIGKMQPPRVHYYPRFSHDGGLVLILFCQKCSSTAAIITSSSL